MKLAQGPPGRGLRGLAGRLAVVTGAGGEIGTAICLRLAAEGVAVLATDRTTELAESVVATLREHGVSAAAVGADIMDPGQVESIVPFAIESFGRNPEILVSCAGVQTFADVLELRIEDWDHVFDVNARGTFLVMKAVAPAMVGARRGAMVAVASLQARLGSRYYAHYSASKAAVLSIVRSFAVSLAPAGVRVNSVAPGIVDTRLWRTADRELARIRGVPPGQPRRERIAQVPLRRAGTPDDVAGAVAFLASEDAAYITGECIHVCGGDLML